MACPRFRQANPSQASFGLACGARLGPACGACGTELPAGARFCRQCGQPVAIRPSAPSQFASPETYTPRHLAERILTSRAEGLPLEIRVGLISGEVVVRSIQSDLHMDDSARGQTTHVAARMEQMALHGSPCGAGGGGAEGGDMRPLTPVRIALLALVLAAAPLAAEAQQARTVHRIGYIAGTATPAAAHLVEAFRQGLCERGHV